MTGSLIERAAQLYDFGAAMRGRSDALAASAPAPAPAPGVVKPVATLARRPVPGRFAAIDRALLADQGFILPEAAVSALAEEFRIVKRQLLQAALGEGAGEGARTILLCSAQPDEGKTFCAVNLALSLATERDLEVVLVDADVVKPSILSALGLENGPGLIDTILDPGLDVESCLIGTDIGSLSVLPAGVLANEATELLASERARAVFERLAEPANRILILDSPPVLAASIATALADRAGQILFVVRADRTQERSLAGAIALIGGRAPPQLLLNAVTHLTGGARFGSYYGYGG